MTKKAFPFSSGPGENVTEAEWSAMASSWSDNGVVGHPGGTDCTIEPASGQPGKIQINNGVLVIDGFALQITEPEFIDTVPNGGLSARRDLIVAELDLESKDIVIKILQGSTNTASSVSGIQVPLGYWSQPISDNVTGSFWGSAEDARQFNGNRIQAALSNSVPRAAQGGMYYTAEDDGTPVVVYLARLDSNGNWVWRPWHPLSTERIEPQDTFWVETNDTPSANWFSNDAWAEPITAPPSGAFYVTLSARIECNPTGTVVCSFAVRDADTGVQVYQAVNERGIAKQGPDYVQCAWRGKLDGLTPGKEYQVRPYWRTATPGNTARAAHRRIVVEPVYTEVAPSESPGGGTEIDPADFVSTSGGSVIQIPNGDVTTQSLGVRVPAGDRAGAPDTMAFYVNNGTDEVPDWQRVTWFNEYGELRVVPSAPTRVGARFKLNAGQSANLFEITDIGNNVISGVDNTGVFFGPGIGGDVTVSKGATAPVAPAVGDVWVDTTSTASPAPKVRATSGWYPFTLGALIPDEVDPEAEAPAFVGATAWDFVGTTNNVSKPTGVEDDSQTMIALVTANGTAAPATPAGWTLLDSHVASQGWSGVYTAPGSASGTGNIAWTWSASTRSSIIVAGFTACTVAVFSDALKASSNMISTAPSLVVPTGDHTVIRAWWTRASQITGYTLDAEAPGEFLAESMPDPGDAGTVGMVAAYNLPVNDTTVPAEDTAFAQSAANANGGGWTLALASL